MRIVGLDVSLTRTGVARADGTAEVLRPPKGMRGAERMAWIRDGVLVRCGADVEGRVAVCPRVDVVAIEAVYVGMGKGKTALDLAGIGWIVRVALWEAGIPYADVPPAVLKRYALGKGGGKGTDKLAMVVAAGNRLGYDTPVPDDNEADALWLRALASAAYRCAVVEMPVAQTQASVAAITWPRVPARIGYQP